MEPLSKTFHPGPELVLTVADGTDPASTAEVRRRAALLLDEAVGEDMADDRFTTSDGTPIDLVAGLATLDGHPVAYVGASASRGRLQFDVIADEAVAGGVVDVAGATFSAVGRSYLEQHPEQAGELILELWGRPHRSWHDELAHRLDLIPHRALFQMRCPLPPASIVEVLPTRSYAYTDGPAVVAVNNRGFAAHPDQSGLTIADLESASTQPWFEANGLRIYEASDQVAGFCWTKRHPAHGPRPAMGEIYVIAVDPDFHGRGLGTGLTAAGLSWLHKQGLDVGMLYVEADNEPALRTYHKLGFTRHRTDTAWRMASPSGPGTEHLVGDG